MKRKGTLNGIFDRVNETSPDEALERYDSSYNRSFSKRKSLIKSLSMTSKKAESDFLDTMSHLEATMKDEQKEAK